MDRASAPDSVVAGGAVGDTIAPTTLAGASESAPGTATVTLTASDEGGSGVTATYYVVGAGSDPVRYAGPFSAPIGSAVKFRSVDGAGNVEDVQQLVVDDGSNLSGFAPEIAPGAHLSRLIAPAGDEDWFRFAADGVSSYRMQLIGLPADYDLELYDSSGTLITAPRRRGVSSEEIRSTLAAGSYYLRVVGYTGAWSAVSPYQLKLQTLGG